MTLDVAPPARPSRVPVDVAASRAELTPGSARSLLLTILGEFVRPSGQPAWTSALLDVMVGLGVEERTARQAIMRAASSSWIVSEKHGREVTWTLTPWFDKVIEGGLRRVESLSDPFDDWDGEWLVLLVTIPHALRVTRKRLYAGLTWAGFGNPVPGVWLTPHPERHEQMSTLIESLGLAPSTMSFVGSVGSIGLDERQIVSAGWDLSALEDRYATVERALRDVRPEPGEETLFTHIRMLGEWQRFPFSDPQLPEALAPDWIGRRVSARIEELRAAWSADVQAEWAAINSARSTGAE